MKKFIFYFFGFIILVISVLVIIATFFEDAISNKLLKEINKSLKKEITISQVELSLIRSFPRAQISLKDVIIPDTRGKSLLEAKRLSFLFPLSCLFNDNYSIQTLNVQDGKLFVHYDKSGEGNYDIFKSVEGDGSTDESFSIALQEAGLNDIVIRYKDDGLAYDFQYKVDNAKIGGTFKTDQYQLKLTGELVSDFMKMEDDQLLVNKEIYLDGGINIDLKKNQYQFEKLVCNIEANEFLVSGEMSIQDKHSDYNIRLTGRDCSLESVSKLLPEEYLNDLEGIESSGTFKLLTSVKGRSSKNESPAILVNMGLSNGMISHPLLLAPLEKVSFNLTYSNGKEKNSKNSILDLRDFKGNMNKEPLSLTLKIKDFETPKIFCLFEGELHVGTIYPLLGNPKLIDASGIIDVNDFSLDGYYSDMIQPSRINRVSTTGSFRFSDVFLDFEDDDITVTDGNLTVDNNLLDISNLKIEGLGSDFRISGDCTNLIPVLFADSLNSKNARLKFDASLKSDHIDLDKVFAFSPFESDEATSKEQKAEEGNENRNRITNFLDGTFQAMIGGFNYRKIEGEKLTGKMTFDKSILSLDDITMEAMEGDFELDGEVYFSKKPHLEARIYCNKIDAKTFFQQGENFGQEMLTDEHIDGILDARILIRSFWDEQGVYQDDKLYVICDLNCKNGELKQLDILESFSNYVKVDDLEHIKFEELSNYFEVKDNQLIIPVMFIQNNAMNMHVAGIHGFNGKIDYQVQFNVAQVLWNKINPFKKKKKAIKAKNGWSNLYYLVFGSTDAYQYKMDQERVLKKFQKAEKRKDQIHANLEDVFQRDLNLPDLEEEIEDKVDISSLLDFSDDEDPETIDGF